jgi:transposase
VYAYCIGLSSSRKMDQHLHEDIAFRVLAANNVPEFRTISDFRKNHLEALGDLFLQVLSATSPTPTLASCQGLGVEWMRKW